MAFYFQPHLLYFVPTNKEMRSLGAYPIVPSYICQGNLDLALENNQLSELVGMLDRAMYSGYCDELQTWKKGLEGSAAG
jgi:hypothetical protein